MRNKRVKIVATIGPASLDHIEELVQEGVNVFRITLSHPTREWVLDAVKRIRDVEKKLQRPVAILGDLGGPKIRIGKVEKGTELKTGDTIEIVPFDVIGNKDRISVNYPDIVKQLQPGAEIYIDDGKIKLQVEKETEEGILAKVIVGNTLIAHKGFYGQGISLDLHGLSPKDQEDLKLMVECQADAVAVSFVQSEKDIQLVRELLPKDSQIALIAKIETVKSLENIEKIIDVSDIIMVARGDLGLAVPMEEVPHLQKKLIQMCLQKAKPVITATQMLESMITNPIPTRAEVTDVANAIMDGTDAVMLSAETALGKFPVETVKMMTRIIKRAVGHIETIEHQKEKTIENAISESVGRIADHLGAKIIIAFTESGSTARRISRNRHQQSIIAVSPNYATIHKLCFSYGVYAMPIEPTKDFDDMMSEAKKIAIENKITPLEKGEPFIIVAGMPFGQAGSTNIIYVEKA